MGDDAARFLTTVLQGMQSEGDNRGGVIDANDAKDAAFLFQFVVVTAGPVGAQEFSVKWMGGGHEIAQIIGHVGQLRIRGFRVGLGLTLCRESVTNRSHLCFIVVMKGLCACEVPPLG